jgi:hypothetical protein
MNMDTYSIPLNDLDLETLLGIAERVSSTGTVSLLKTEMGWTCSFEMHKSLSDLNYYETPQEALVAVIAVPRSRVSG